MVLWTQAIRLQGRVQLCQLDALGRMRGAQNGPSSTVTPIRRSQSALGVLASAVKQGDILPFQVQRLSQCSRPCFDPARDMTKTG